MSKVYAKSGIIRNFFRSGGWSLVTQGSVESPLELREGQTYRLHNLAPRYVKCPPVLVVGPTVILIEELRFDGAVMTCSEDRARSEKVEGVTEAKLRALVRFNDLARIAIASAQRERYFRTRSQSAQQAFNRSTPAQAGGRLPWLTPLTPANADRAKAIAEICAYQMYIENPRLPMRLPDDLTLIEGITPEIQSVLYGLGYFFYDSIAAWRVSDINRVDECLGVENYNERASWIEQAFLLIKFTADAAS